MTIREEGSSVRWFAVGLGESCYHGDEIDDRELLKIANSHRTRGGKQPFTIMDPA
jgi:hypothetical protein